MMRIPGTICDLLSRDPPWHSILKAIDAYESNNLQDHGCIVEIGCSRGKLSYDLFEDSKERDLDLDGHSTSYFASLNVPFYSVDIESSHCEIARSDVKLCYPDNDQALILCEDGIKFLLDCNLRISFLFLDAFDLDLPQSAEKHLEALQAAMPKMSEKSIILIDDTDLDRDHVNKVFLWSSGNSGKGKLAIPYAIENEYKVIFNGRQTLLGRGII